MHATSQRNLPDPTQTAHLSHRPQPPGWGHKLMLLALLIIALGLLLALVSHDSQDAAWSSTGQNITHKNWLGSAGAWLADISLTSFGYSTIWILVVIIRHCLSLTADLLRPRDAWLHLPEVSIWYQLGTQLRVWLGFNLLLMSSCTLEWLRLSSTQHALPDQAGGVLGFVIGSPSIRLLGADGAGILWISVLVFALSWALKFSWLGVADLLGSWLVSQRHEKQMRKEVEVDNQLGQQALREREQRLEPAPTQWQNLVSAPQAPNRPQAAAPWSTPVAAAPAAAPAPTPASHEIAEYPPAAPVSAWRNSQNVNLEQAISPPLSTSAELFPIQRIDDIRTAPVIPTSAAVQETRERTASMQSTSAPALADTSVATPATETSVFPSAAAPRVIGSQPQAFTPSERLIKEQQSSLPKDEYGQQLPPISLLDPPSEQIQTISAESLEMTSRLIEKKLKDFGVTVRVVAAYPGPVVTRYEIEPATGVKGSQIVNLAKDLARSLSLMSIRVVETIPGKNYMALELPNPKRSMIRLSEVMGSDVYDRSESMLTMGLGKDIVGKPIVADLAKMPHCLVAGTTGSGKSVGINAMILGILYKALAQDVRMILIDPKMLELSIYEGIPHLLCPVVTDMKHAGHALNWCVAEMERRYKLMSKMQVRNIAGFNKKLAEAHARGDTLMNPLSFNPEDPEPLEKLPFIVVVIDELADLMMVVGKKVEELIARLAQKARAAGIHLVLATQRPSVDVITGLIKANVPTRLSFQVSSKIDSRTILDQMGAEALLGMGDMLFMMAGTGIPDRVHGAFVSDEEVIRVVNFLKEQGEPNYVEGLLEGGVLDDDSGFGAGTQGADAETDELYDQAVAIVLTERRASTSFVQRKLSIGYNRAARLMEQMEAAGLVSAMSGSNNRDILVPPPQH